MGRSRAIMIIAIVVVLVVAADAPLLGQQIPRAREVRPKNAGSMEVSLFQETRQQITKGPRAAAQRATVVIQYRGTFTMAATTGDWHYVGNGDEKASATISFSFDITLQRPASGGRLLKGEAAVRPPWSGEWAKRSSRVGCSERSGSVKGTGGDGVKILGEFDPGKPDQVKIAVDYLNLTTLVENLESFPSECPYFVSSVRNLLFASFWDCSDKISCTIFKASGNSLSFGATGGQIGIAQRQYLYSTGRYTGTAQLTLVSETRR